MPNDNAIYGFVLLLATMLPAAGVFLWASMRLKKSMQQVENLEELLEELKKVQSQTVKGTIGMGQRMLRLEKRVKLLTDQPLGELEPEKNFSYSQASQMIEQGADLDTIASTCGISYSEAHLMQRLCAEGLPQD